MAQSVPMEIAAGAWGDPADAARLPELWSALARLAGSGVGVRTDPRRGGLTARQLRALHCLRNDGLTMRAFAQACGIGGSASTHLADRLVRNGLVDRRADASDRRVVRLVLTRAGTELADHHRRSQIDALSGMLSRIAPERRASATTAIDRLTVIIGGQPRTAAIDCPTLVPSR